MDHQATRSISLKKKAKSKASSGDHVASPSLTEAESLSVIHRCMTQRIEARIQTKTLAFKQSTRCEDMVIQALKVKFSNSPPQIEELLILNGVLTWPKGKGGPLPRKVIIIFVQNFSKLQKTLCALTDIPVVLFYNGNDKEDQITNGNTQIIVNIWISSMLLSEARQKLIEQDIEDSKMEDAWDCEEDNQIA